MWREALWVGAGGFVGSVLRYWISAGMARYSTSLFPWGTLTVNLVGCLSIGLLAGFFEHAPSANAAWRLFFVVGWCGGFTTFSTFASESLFLLRSGQTAFFFLNAVVSFVAGLSLVWIGFRGFGKG